MYEMLYAGISADMYRQESLNKAENRRLLRALKRAKRANNQRNEPSSLAWSQNLAAKAQG